MITTILIRVEGKTKERFREIAKNERRSMSSLILALIDDKIRGVKNARK